MSFFLFPFCCGALGLACYYAVFLPLYRQVCRRRAGVAPEAMTVAFFHPYCNAGGGGERVLWLAIQALASMHDKQQVERQMGGKAVVPLHVFIYTGDLDATSEDILKRAEAHFGVKLQGLQMPLTFLFIRGRSLLEAARYPVLTMLGQSVGSILLAFVCLVTFLPDVFIDTTGFAFTYPVAALLGRCRVAAYVHYPTISTDMLSLVREQRPSYNNDQAVAGSSLKSKIKLLYYYGFALLYGACGCFVSLVMVNSSWTKGHIQTLWRLVGPKIWTVFPPCDCSSFQDLPLSPREPLILAVGQFRPEKDHPLQIRAFARYLRQAKLEKKGKNDKNVRLVLLGSCRGAEDEARVEALRELAVKEGVAEEVEFVVGASFPELKRWLGRASVGLHTMWNEHFGICVVEYMAAGLVTVAHNSGGPKADIVVPYQGAPTGFLAATEEEYADAFAHVFSLKESDLVPLRANARASIERFSNEVFLKDFQRLMAEFLDMGLDTKDL